MEQDGSALKREQQVSGAEESTQEEDQSLSSNEHRHGVISPDKMIAQTLSASREEDLSTLGAESVIITSAARVIDDVETGGVPDFLKLRLNLEEKLEIIGIDRFRQYQNLDTGARRNSPKKKSGICTCLKHAPLLTKMLVLIGLILLATAFVIIIAALIISDGSIGREKIAASDVAGLKNARDFDVPSPMDELAPPAPTNTSSIYQPSMSQHPLLTLGNNTGEPVEESTDEQNNISPNDVDALRDEPIDKPMEDETVDEPLVDAMGNSTVREQVGGAPSVDEEVDSLEELPSTDNEPSNESPRGTLLHGHPKHGHPKGASDSPPPPGAEFEYEANILVEVSVPNPDVDSLGMPRKKKPAKEAKAKTKKKKKRNKNKVSSDPPPPVEFEYEANIFVEVPVPNHPDVHGVATLANPVKAAPLQKGAT